MVAGPQIRLASQSRVRHEIELEITIDAKFEISSLGVKINTETLKYENLTEEQYMEIVNDLYKKGPEAMSRQINVNFNDSVAVNMHEVQVSANDEDP